MLLQSIRSLAAALLLLPIAAAQPPADVSPAALPAPTVAPSATTTAAGTATLSDSLNHAGERQLHILYIHGMAANGAGDYDSWGLRKSICDYLKDCTSSAGEIDGHEYADQDEFALTAPLPTLQYLGRPIWRSAEEWHAAAPFVIHWKITRASGAAIYVDEIDWWPLVFALKCREIVDSESEVIGPSEPFITMCSRSEADAAFPGRFISYPWIAAARAATLRASPEKGAPFNRAWKGALLDWGMSDAVIAAGNLRPVLVDGIRQLILKSVRVNAHGTRGLGAGPEPRQEFVIVSHSLGSYLMFAALDVGSANVNAKAAADVREQFQNILRHTSQVYFFANQVRFLELADLNDSSTSMYSHLQEWADLRTQYLQQSGATGEGRPRIIAWNDPSDLLSWSIPQVGAVIVRNIAVKNAPHWFGLFENPAKAHSGYAQNKKVIRQMLR